MKTIVGDEVISSDRTAKLYGANYKRLQQIKKKYDPDMTFNKWMPIIPS